MLTLLGHSRDGQDRKHELAIFDRDREELAIVASYNLGGKGTTGTRMRVGEGAMGHVALTREPYIIPDYQAWAARSD